MKRFVSLRTANHWHSCVTIARFVLLKQELWLRQSVKVNRRKRSWFTFRIACRESEMQREIERVSCFARCGIHQDILPISSSRAYHALVGLASCMHVHWFWLCSLVQQGGVGARLGTQSYWRIQRRFYSSPLSSSNAFLSSRPSMKVPLLSTDVQQGTQSCRHIPLCLAHSGERMCNVAGFTCTAGG